MPGLLRMNTPGLPFDDVLQRDHGRQALQTRRQRGGGRAEIETLVGRAQFQVNLIQQMDAARELQALLRLVQASVALETGGGRRPEPPGGGRGTNCRRRSCSRRSNR